MQQIASSFDDFVGRGEQRRRHREAERLGGPKVYHQLVLGRPLHWQVGWLLALEDAIDVSRRAPEVVDQIRRIGHQASHPLADLGGLEASGYIIAAAT